MHRHAAGLLAALAELPCEVRPGGLRDAILHSVGANATHGLRRTNADKQRAVQLLLADDEWAGWSDNAVAKACAVSQPFAAKVRADHLQTFEDAPRTVSRGGKVFSMDTARIGRRPAAPEPDPPLDPPAQDAAQAVPPGNLYPSRLLPSHPDASGPVRRQRIPSGGATMSDGIPLLILALGTLGGIFFLAAGARKAVADKKGDPERSSIIRDHGGAPRPNRPGTEH